MKQVTDQQVFDAIDNFADITVEIEFISQVFEAHIERGVPVPEVMEATDNGYDGPEDRVIMVALGVDMSEQALESAPTFYTNGIEHMEDASKFLWETIGDDFEGDGSRWVLVRSKMIDYLVEQGVLIAD